MFRILIILLMFCNIESVVRSLGYELFSVLKTTILIILIKMSGSQNIYFNILNQAGSQVGGSQKVCGWREQILSPGWDSFVDRKKKKLIELINGIKRLDGHQYRGHADLREGKKDWNHPLKN